MQSPTVVMMADQQGHLKYVNPAFCEVTGYRFIEEAGEKPKFS
jgi:PAS domain S-box-containing protein